MFLANKAMALEMARFMRPSSGVESRTLKTSAPGGSQLPERLDLVRACRAICLTSIK